jgi:hypothetical protein
MSLLALLAARRRRVAVFAIAAGAMSPACTGPGTVPGPAPDSATSEDVAPDAVTSDAVDRDAVAPPSDVCLEVETRPNIMIRTSYLRTTWDPALRILTVQESPSSTFATGISTLKWRYASEGRIIAYIGVEQPFQHDYRYDEHENVVEFRLSYPQTPDLMTPSTAPTVIGWSYDHQYDAIGRLIGSIKTSSDGGAGDPASQRAYFEDGAGRCKRIESVSPDVPYLEQRLYDDAGRLSRIDAMQGSGTSAATRTEITTYDDQGRIHRRSGTFSGPAGYLGSGTLTRTYDFAEDGSETITTNDDTTDVLSDRVVILTRSAACQAIDAAIGAPVDQRCRVR